MVLHGPKITKDRQQSCGNCDKKFHYYQCLQFVISSFGIFYYLLLHAQITRITNSEYSITTSFLENISNSINHLLSLFLSVLTLLLIFDQHKKLRKSEYRYVFIVLYVYYLYCLRQEIDKSFWKDNCCQ